MPTNDVPGALVGIAARLEALVAATGTFRTLVTSRLEDYADEVGRAMKTATSRLDHERRAQDRVTTELIRRVDGAETSLGQLARTADGLADELARLVDEVASLRRRVGLRAKAPDLENAQIAAIADAVARALSGVPADARPSTSQPSTKKPRRST